MKSTRSSQHRDTRDDVLVALGEKFSHLKLDAMKKVVEQTKFYGTSDAGLALFNGTELKETMTKVVGFCVDEEIVGESPSLGYGSEGDVCAPASTLPSWRR